MQLYPAIDMKNGQCVRLKQGRFEDVSIYDTSPAAVARRWQAAGASFLHLVDLDGALAGWSVNETAVKEILSCVDLKVQLGGGIRSAGRAAHLLDLGVDRVIIGTKAVENPECMKELIREFGAEKIVAGIDAKDGMAATDGWEKVSGVSALELCLLLKDYGLRHVVYTDISKDGMLSGPNVEYTRLLAEKTGIDIIASGGISSMEDLRLLKEAEIRGAIIGKALYEEKIDLVQAIRTFEQEK